MELESYGLLNLTYKTIKNEKRLPTHFDNASLKGPGQKYVDMTITPSKPSNTFTSGIFTLITPPDDNKPMKNTTNSQTK